MKLFRRAMIAGCLVTLLSLSAFAASGSFKLHVNDVSGLDSPWPMVGGLPFPEGELRDPAHIRIVNAEGEEVPAQIDVTATWPDGSVRWALAGINASPQDEYRVEYGPDISRSVPDHPLTVTQAADGVITVDTHAAVYEFKPDRLLPETARVDDTVFLSDAGDGAYLIDNRGRLTRVAGEGADIETQILKQGSIRTVIRRAGWYVTKDGERVARSKAWFYFTAGTPFVRITHSIVLTEDTNKLWVRDYGLEFRAPKPPEEAVFALSEATWTDNYMGGRGLEDKQERRELAEMFSSGLVDREQRLFRVARDGGETYMLQDNYPHVLERKFRAIVARAPSPLMTDEGGIDEDDLWVHPWLKECDVAGDWAEARYDDHALTVVMPQLAQRFPKEIAVGPNGPRVAFWSGRSGRELDFRAVTLVNEYWGKWADNAIHAFEGPDLKRGPAIGSRVARLPSDARGAARTHDVWLLPRTGDISEEELKARALAASHPPLLQADPAWLGDSAAIGWPMHPKDTARFPEVEKRISDQWEEIFATRYGNADLRRTGFIMWGKHATLGNGVRWFRFSTDVGHYKQSLNTALLYARGGERRYYDYMRHFNRFSGDLSVHHWTAGGRFKGGFAKANTALPLYWQGASEVGGSFWTPSWLMEYRLTGDEYASELLTMVADAYCERAKPDKTLGLHTYSQVYNLSILYEHTRYEKIRTIVQKAAREMIDLDNPTGLNDDLRYGVYYKPGTEWLFPLYLYYNATGDEMARKAILRCLDDKFRFFYSSNQTVRLFLFAEAYRWTGKRAYLRLVKLMVDEPFYSLFGHNYLLGAPAALHAIANAEQPIGQFPVLAATREENSVVRSAFTGHIMPHTFIEGDVLPPVLVEKKVDTPVTLSIYVRTGDEVDEDAEPVVRVVKREPTGGDAEVNNVRIEKEQRYKSRNRGRNYPRRWHVYVTLPAEAEAGSYSIAFPNAATVIVLESGAADVQLGGDGG